MDLFCGIGSIGMSLAQHCKHVYGFESSASAVADARQSMALSDISNVTIVHGNLAKVSATLGKKFPKPDVIVTGRMLSMLFLLCWCAVHALLMCYACFAHVLPLLCCACFAHVPPLCCSCAVHALLMCCLCLLHCLFLGAGTVRVDSILHAAWYQTPACLNAVAGLLVCFCKLGRSTSAVSCPLF